MIKTKRKKVSRWATYYATQRIIAEFNVETVVYLNKISGSIPINYAFHDRNLIMRVIKVYISNIIAYLIKIHIMQLQNNSRCVTWCNVIAQM